jgi:hypothetical protein
MDKIEDIFQMTKHLFQIEMKNQVDSKAHEIIRELCPDIEFADVLDLKEIMDPQMKDGENTSSDRIKKRYILERFNWKKLIEEKIDIIFIGQNKLGGTTPNLNFVLTKSGIMLYDKNLCLEFNCGKYTHTGQCTNSAGQSYQRTWHSQTKCYPVDFSQCKNPDHTEKRDSDFCYECIRKDESFMFTKQQIEIMNFHPDECGMREIIYFKTHPEFSETAKQGRILEKTKTLSRENKTELTRIQAELKEIADLRQTLFEEQQKHANEVKDFLSRQERERKLQTARSLELSEREEEVEENENKFSSLINIENIFKSFKRIIKKLHDNKIYSDELDEIEENIYRRKNPVTIAKSVIISSDDEEEKQDIVKVHASIGKRIPKKV